MSPIKFGGIWAWDVEILISLFLINAALKACSIALISQRTCLPSKNYLQKECLTLHFQELKLKTLRSWRGLRCPIWPSPNGLNFTIWWRLELFSYFLSRRIRNYIHNVRTSMTYSPSPQKKNRIRQQQTVRESVSAYQDLNPALLVMLALPRISMTAKFTSVQVSLISVCSKWDDQVHSSFASSWYICQSTVKNIDMRKINLC